MRGTMPDVTRYECVKSCPFLYGSKAPYPAHLADELGSDCMMYHLGYACFRERNDIISPQTRLSYYSSAYEKTDLRGYIY